MAVFTTNSGAGRVDAQGAAAASLDAAAEYLRSRLDRVLPLYVLAMAPHAVASILLIDAVVAEQRSAVPPRCVLLVAATIWRWVGLAYLQHRVEQDLHGWRQTRFWPRVGPILLLRLWGNIAIVWGGALALVPAFYGLFVGSFAAPLLLNNAEPVLVRLGQSLSWIRHSSRRLVRVVWAMTAITALLTIALFVSQAVLAQTVLPSILGIDTVDLNITLDSWAWRFRMLYFVFLVIDLFWTVASVFLFDDSQARRMASDLRSRLLALQVEQA